MQTTLAQHTQPQAEPLLAALQEASGRELLALLFRFELAEPFMRQLKERAVVFQSPDLSEPAVIAEAAVKAYCQKHRLSKPEELQRWCLERGMKRDDLLSEAIHDWRREELRSKISDTSSESLYLRYKDNLDRVLYSLIRVEDPGLCRELFYAIEAEEISFGEAARLHSRDRKQRHKESLAP